MVGGSGGRGEREQVQEIDMYCCFLALATSIKNTHAITLTVTPRFFMRVSLTCDLNNVFAHVHSVN